MVIYTSAPKEYEVIGIVTASSNATYLAQINLDYAVAELKKQAAEIGANGIIIGNSDATNEAGGLIGNIWVKKSMQNIVGTAVFVPNNRTIYIPVPPGN